MSLCYKFKGNLTTQLEEKGKYFDVALQQINKCKELIAQNASTKDTELVNEIYDELISLSSDAMKYLEVTAHE
jgi:hypothetical protein